MNNATLRMIGLATAFVVLLAACGRSGPGDDGGTAPSPQTSDAPMTEPAPTPMTALAPDATPVPGSGESPAAAPEVPALDYLTFAQGAVPIHIGGAGADLGANFEHAVRIIDGNPQYFGFTDAVDAETADGFVNF